MIWIRLPKLVHLEDVWEWDWHYRKYKLVQATATESQETWGVLDTGCMMLHAMPAVCLNDRQAFKCNDCVHSEENTTPKSSFRGVSSYARHTARRFKINAQGMIALSYTMLTLHPFWPILHTTLLLWPALAASMAELLEVPRSNSPTLNPLSLSRSLTKHKTSALTASKPVLKTSP